MKHNPLATGRMKPCAHCGTGFWCSPSKDVGGSLPERKYCGNPCVRAAKAPSEAKAQASFWSRVDKNGDCWIYKGSLFWNGYGHVNYLRKDYGAHQLAWILTHGDTKGMHVLHTCDNRPCCNPDHLFLGTIQDNAADKVRKRRHAFGERSRRNKLTEAQVREILANPPKQGLGGNVLEYANRYGVGRGAINQILRGNYWKHISRSAPQASLQEKK